MESENLIKGKIDIVLLNYIKNRGNLRIRINQILPQKLETSREKCATNSTPVEMKITKFQATFCVKT